MVSVGTGPRSSCSRRIYLDLDLGACATRDNKLPNRDTWFDHSASRFLRSVIDSKEIKERVLPHTNNAQCLTPAA